MSQIKRLNGSFFGTLCAIDPDPHTVDTPEMHATFELLAQRVMDCIDAQATLPAKG